jgi:hypothetical protein
MADRVARAGGSRFLRIAAGVLAGAVLAAAVVVAAIVSFDLNPVGPALVALGALVGGGLLVARASDPILKGAGFGLVAGGLIAVLLWPLFAVDSGSIEDGLTG